MNKEKAKKRIERLIKKYELLTSLQLKRYNESMTCKDFILPLFQALGWDINNKFFDEEVTSEKQVSGKRVDYAFHVDGVTKFFIEAKKIEVDLREEKWAEQAIMYAWHKSVPWAILTDFESIKVFNAEWDEPDAEQSLLFEIPYQDYLTDKRLWFLSKKSFENGELDKYAEDNFKKPKREPIDKQLAADLIRWRDNLSKQLRAWNDRKKFSDFQIIESVQKILNRLIFIRTTEDRGIEDQRLREIIRNWEKKEERKDFFSQELKKLLKYYWDEYDSKLFKKHTCDLIEYQDEFIADIISELYKNQKGIRYNFASIPADVLGTIYEQYLGQIQQEEVIDKKSSKRKSQGIYYTPRYIVDYIIKNTLSEVSKEKSLEEIKNIKILDPACGSGSFLIKVLEELVNYWQMRTDKNVKYEKGTHLGNLEKSFKMRRGQKELSSSFKIGLLRNNIYGIDLDEKAVEIAQLNLLLKTMQRRQLLPDLSHSLACGNSLISGTEKELKKYFGKDWKKKKSFNWEEKFPEVFNRGGFDIVIGNPPYIDSEEMVKKDKKFRLYCSDVYKSAKGNWDIFCLFIQKGLDLLKKGGYLGMIMPNKLLSANYAESIRTIIKKYSIISINDYSNIKVFGANVYPIVIIIQKNKPSKNHEIIVNSYSNIGEQIKIVKTKRVKQTILEKYKKSWSPIFDHTEGVNFVDRIMENSEKLGELCDVRGAATVSEAYQLKEIIEDLTDNNKKDYFKFINTGTIDRYISLWDCQKTRYIKSAYLRPVINKKRLKKVLPKRYEQTMGVKIIVAGMTKKLECFLDEKDEYLAGKSTTVIKEKDMDIKFIIGLLNSKLLTFIYKNVFKSLSLQGGYLRVGAPQLKEIPIIIPSKKEIKEISNMVNKIIKLSKNLQELHSIMDDKEYKEIELEIQKTDKVIDQLVYKLYGLSKEEIKIVNKM